MQGQQQPLLQGQLWVCNCWRNINKMGAGRGSEGLFLFKILSDVIPTKFVNCLQVLIVAFWEQPRVCEEINKCLYYLFSASRSFAMRATSNWIWVFVRERNQTHYISPKLAYEMERNGYSHLFCATIPLPLSSFPNDNNLLSSL